MKQKLLDLNRMIHLGMTVESMDDAHLIIDRLISEADELEKISVSPVLAAQHHRKQQEAKQSG